MSSIVLVRSALCASHHHLLYLLHNRSCREADQKLKLRTGSRSVLAGRCGTTGWALRVEVCGSTGLGRGWRLFLSCAVISTIRPRGLHRLRALQSYGRARPRLVAYLRGWDAGNCSAPDTPARMLARARHRQQWSSSMHLRRWFSSRHRLFAR